MSSYVRAWKIIKLGAVCGRMKLSGRSSELPRLIYVQLRELGGVYVKFLQLMVVQSETFRSLADYDMYDVYDQAGYDKLDIDLLLRNELGVRARDIKIADKQPFAAGSFGQVYRATYQGHDIIIKALRPSVQRTLPSDLRLISGLGWLIDMFTPGGAVSARRVCKDLIKVTRAEIDYALEADYAMTMYKRYQNHPHLQIPYTFREVSTRHLICQEYVGGVAASDLLRLQEQGVNARQYVQDTTGSDLVTQMTAFGTELLTSAFAYGTTYGDPHPGNIKFLPQNKIALIDYGLQAASPKNLPAFQRLVEQYSNIYNGQPDISAYSRALLDVYGGDIIEAVSSLESQLSSSKLVVDSIVHSAEQLLDASDPQTQQLLEDNRLTYLFNNVLNKNNRYCLQYDVDGSEFIRASILFTKLTRLYGINREVLQPTYNTVASRIRSYNFVSQKEPLHPETALEIIAAWLDQLSLKNPHLHYQITQGDTVHA